MLPLAHAKVLAGSHFDNPCNTEDIFSCAAGLLMSS